MKILVVEASGLHLGFLGCYGNDWIATPNLDRLAAEGIVFDQHIADCPEPAPAGPWRQRSVMTGMYTFPSTAREAAPDGSTRYEVVAALPHFGKHALALLDIDAPILWVDGPSLMPPWDLPDDLLSVYADDDAPDELEELQSTYAAVVTWFDAQLGRVLDALRERGRLDGLLVCVTARCGLPLDEHGMVGPKRAWLHDEFVHVPLIMRLPGAEEAGLRLPALTQSIDLMPTLHAHLGIAGPEVQGRSLWPLIRGETEHVRPYAASGLRLGASEEWLLRTPDRALLLPIAVPADDTLIWEGEAPAEPTPAARQEPRPPKLAHHLDGAPRRAQMYIKPDDRWEVNDLALRFEEEAEQLQQTLRAFVGATRRDGPLAYPPLPDEITAIPEESS